MSNKVHAGRAGARLPVLVAALVAAACSPLAGGMSQVRPGEGAAEEYAGADSARVRNLILVVGDGMGPQQIGLALLEAREQRRLGLRDGRSPLEEILAEGVTGLVSTTPSHYLVTDSAAAASQLATGRGALPGSIGIDAAGRPVGTLLERASARGMATGLVSDTRITHATPAAFAAHGPDRRDESGLASALLDSDADLLLSGGMRYFLPASIDQWPADRRSRYAEEREIPVSTLRSRREDERDLLAEAEQRGWNLALHRGDLAAASLPVLGLFSSSGMPGALALQRGRTDGAEGQGEGGANPPATRVPTLEEMTSRALELLSADAQGFFLMVEAGQIDWACHQNDVGGLMAEMARLERVLEVISGWARARDDTLVVLTADHETGSFGLSFSGHDIPDALPRDRAMFGASGYQPVFNFVERRRLAEYREQTHTLLEIMDRFDDLPESEQTPESLQALVRRYTPWRIGRGEARRVLATGPNRFRIPGHRYLGGAESSEIGEYEAFYPYPGLQRPAMLGRALAAQQGAVWGTGTHTSTPVLVTARGPEGAARPFAGLHDGPRLGRLLHRALGLDSE